METSVGAHSFEQKCSGLNSKLNSSQKLGGSSSCVSFFWIVEEPDSMVELLLRDESKYSASLVNIRRTSSHKMTDEFGECLPVVIGCVLGSFINDLEHRHVVLI